MQDRVETQALFEAGCRVIPGGVNSPVRSFKEVDMLPLVVESGSGDAIRDVDGNTFIDYCMSWGALPLGHADEKVVGAVRDRMEAGCSFGTITPVEKELAEAIISHVPSIEKIRFVSSGTEATMSALRLARGYTERSLVLKFNGNYHGHADPFLVKAGSGVASLPEACSAGVPLSTIQHTISLPYNDPEAVRRAFAERRDIAAVIVEPVAANMGLVPASPEFIRTLVEETKKSGALLIFDEVVSGFRLGLSGAQGIFQVQPDLTCLGKIIGGGLPAAAFGGRKEIMDLLAPLGNVYQAGTLSGNPLAMQAGLATLRQLEAVGFYGRLQEKADFLLQPIEEKIRVGKRNVRLSRMGSLFTFFFEEGEFKKFFRYLFDRGIYVAPSQFETNFISSAHTERSLSYTRDVILGFLND